MVPRLSIVLVSALARLLTACGGGGHEVERERGAVEADGASGAKEPARHLHDHRPEHGGAVAILGAMHVEITASADGLVRVYLNDHERHPIPVAGTTGTIRLALPEGSRAVTLAPAGEVLEARTTPFGVGSALATVSLTREGQTFETNVFLDLTGKRAGVAGVPEAGCVAPSHPAERGRPPRCAVTFASAFTALGTAPDGARVAVAVSHGPTSVWSMPAATVIMGIDPPPPVPILAGQHEPDVRALAFSPDGAEIAVAVGDRIVVFDAGTGRFRRQARSSGGTVQSIAWFPDGKRLVVASAGDGKAHVVDARDGRVLRTLPSEGQASVVAADGSGRAAIGTDVGTIVLVDQSAGVAPRVLTPSLEPVAAVAFAGDRLVSAGTDGTLRVFDPTNGSEAARVTIGTPLVLLAIAPDGRHAATADAAHTLRLHRLPSGAVVEQLAWHRATVSVLGWGAGDTLVSGDNDGVLAVWDRETPPP